MLNKNLGLDDQLHQYVLSVSVKEPEVLAELRQETSNYTGFRMQITPEQGQFLAFLIKLIKAKKALEIGVFTGYSSLVTAIALPEDGKLIACDIDENYTQIARKYWEKAGVSEKINLHIAPALETLDQLLAQGEAETFDFAFIDADKRNYPNYYEKCLQLIRKGGLIAIDNVLWSGKVADPEINDKQTLAIRDFNSKIYQDDRVNLSLIPIADGLTLVIKK